jgi:hypothetical protein
LPAHLTKNLEFLCHLKILGGKVSITHNIVYENYTSTERHVSNSDGPISKIFQVLILKFKMPDLTISKKSTFFVIRMIDMKIFTNFETVRFNMCKIQHFFGFNI